jgi:diguanylate cyclase (GGDEF)-like protein
VSICFIDADFFKSINDRYGHPGGDEALRVIAATLRLTVRLIDFVGRYGGEEFLVIAPGTELADAVTLGERLRSAVEDQPIRLASGATIHATISVGVAEYPDNALTLPALIAAADVALYTAKHEGRNRVVAASVSALP